MTPLEYVMLANAIMQGVNRILEYAQKARMSAQARGEWTEEDERQFDEQIAKLKTPLAPEHWIPQKS